jgi:hypothetical protein
LPGGPQDCNRVDELGVRPLCNRAQRPCSHESIVQGCPVWTANNCRRHGYDTRSPKQDSIAGETVLKTSTGKKDEEEATGFTVTNNALSNRRIECVAGVNVDSTSQHFITSGATLSQPEDSSTSRMRNSPSASMHRSPLSLIARLIKRATRLASNGDCDVYLHAHTLSHIFTIAPGLEPATNCRGIQHRRLLFDSSFSSCARCHRLKQTRWRSRRT